MKALAILVLSIASSTVCGGADPAVAPSRHGIGTDAVHWILALGLVLSLILVLAVVARRLRLGSPIATRSFRVMAAVPLGPRERAVLLQAGKKQLVLGISSGRVETLCTLEGESLIDTETAPLRATPPAFSGQLDLLLKRLRP